MKEFVRSVPWKPVDALVVFLVPWIFLPLVFQIGLQLISIDFAPALALQTAINNNDVKASFSLVLVDAIGSFLLIRYYLNKYEATLSDLGFRKFSVLKAIFYIILLPILFVILLSLALWVAQAFIPGFNNDQVQTNEFIQNTAPSLKIYSILALIVLPPIVEETVFRGFLFPALAKRYGAVAGAVLSSALFGFAHLQGNVSVYTFVLGLLLCWVYYRVGSIIPGMALHMLNNYLAFTALTQK